MVPLYTNVNNSTLKQFIFNNPQNRPYIIIASILVILQFIIFKYIYPYPNFLLGDSYLYIRDARENVQLATHPIGYGMFLRFFSAITISDTVLVAFQFFFLQAAAFSLNFTLYYFFSPAPRTKIILLLAIIINPLFFVVANTISSDNIGLSLGIIWITLLIWIINKPTLRVFFWHAVVVYLAFAFRFNSLFYPIISLLAMWFSKADIKLKFKGVVLLFIFLGSFVIYNREKYYQLCGIRQYSPFTGWQIANNALYTYQYIPQSKIIRTPDKFKKLDSIVNNYFQNSSKRPKKDWEEKKAFDGYMWDVESPLWVYYFQKFKDQRSPGDLKCWAEISPFYKEYGTWLIAHYPKGFFQYIIIPHIFSWVIPPMYSLEKYNYGDLEMPQQSIVNWFKYKAQFIKVRTIDVNVLDDINGLYPLWSGIMNFLFWILILFVVLKVKQLEPMFFKNVIFVSIFWIVNFNFSIIASQIEVRYVLFPIHIMTVFSILMIGRFMAVQNESKA